MGIILISNFNMMLLIFYFYNHIYYQRLSIWSFRIYFKIIYLFVFWIIL